MRSPVPDAPVENRAAFQRTIEHICERASRHQSPDGARLHLGERAARHSATDAEMEAFSRQLWGLAPLVAGGGSFERIDRYREGLASGTDPDHAEYWGEAGDYSQKHVEMAAIGAALAIAPDRFWDPLDADERRAVADWLGQTNDATLPDCNWLWFRVLANLGLRSVGADHDWEQVESDLDRLDSYYMGSGWYADGTDDGVGERDYYVAWEMHTDGLLYAQFADDPERAARYRERAREFAGEYVHWFDGDGPALAYGRSLTYRFAQAAFWGALALADTKPDDFSWGEIRGLWARNVRWWLDQPIFTADGLLSVGYRYPTLLTAETYNAPGSPYWALKAALPLALDDDHPFWAADEEPLPDLPDVQPQSEPNLLVHRDETTGHHYALAAGQAPEYGHVKYNKFAYSSSLGFGVPTRRPGLAGAGHDGALALSTDGRHYRLRETGDDQTVTDAAASARWGPFDDVAVETWLVPVDAWHVRVHRIETERSLSTAEGGFAVEMTGDDETTEATDEASALVRAPGGESGIRDLAGDRDTHVVPQDPNSNLCARRPATPTLTGDLGPGVSWLAAAAVAAPDATLDSVWDRPPAIAFDGDGFAVRDADGAEVYSE
jgi:hypothetical protein